MLDQFRTTRRGLMKAGGYLTVAFSLSGWIPSGAAAQDAELPGDLADNPMLNSWIAINEDGTVTLKIGKVELGQGTKTSAAQIAADELYIDMDRLEVISGDTWVVPNEGTTAGSGSAPNCFPAVQAASAEVRGMLLEMAAEQLGQPADQLTIENGTITAGDGSETTYWDLVSGGEFEREASGNAALMPIEEQRYIGQPIPRLDLPAKIIGRPAYVQDIRAENMAHGKIVRPPTYDATLESVDTSVAEGMPGVIAVVRDGSFLGVIAERDGQALAAANALAENASWNVPEGNLPGNDGIFDWLQAEATDSTEYVNTGSPSGGGAKTMEATYYRPYHMHGSIGTSAAVAQMGDDGVMTIQNASQSVFGTGQSIAAMLGMEPSNVHMQHIDGSGCYGHNMADDAAADAALLARALPGRPVRLQYTREQEHKWEPYGSAMVMNIRANVDDEGNVLDWHYNNWSTGHSTRPSGGDPGQLLSARYLEEPFEQPPGRDWGPSSYGAGRNAEAKYVFPHQTMTVNFTPKMPLRVSATRGLGAFANVFAIESFMDELASDAGVDPLEYRLRFLEDERARAVLMKTAEEFGWDDWEPQRGRGRGIAFAQYKNYAAITAIALEVQVNQRNGRVSVVRATAANDSGHMVNPDNIANQIEGGLIQSLSWALKEEVRFDDTQVLSNDWASYPILTFNEVPNIDVHLINSPGQPYLGTGETSQGPTVGALANAITNATGVRYRRLPFLPSRISDGLRG
ncbi:aldehyde dehydrogenase [Rhodobacteraceae bacterium WD3A24]|nr:aldehyde dehydrogenase [Rhodobacteraceae bacterium WD3A24]